MSLWLIRSGRYGEHMQRILDTNRVYATWDGLKHDLGKLASKKDLLELLRQVYPGSSEGNLVTNTGQLWRFAREMRPGDWVVVPHKGKPAINVAEITGPYVFDPGTGDPYYHYRDVKWVAKDVPRSNFD